MKALLLRAAMVGILFLGAIILSQPTVVRASGCDTSIQCLSKDGSKSGTCGSDCYCYFPDGTRQFDRIDCTPL